MCELIIHPDFSEWLAGLEVYLDRKVLENLEIVNTSYRVMLDTILKNVKLEERDEYIVALKEGSIDGDDYLRFRLSQRFDKIARSLYAAHKKEAEAETGSAEEAKLTLLADQLGVNIGKSTAEEKRSLLSLFSRSKFAQFITRRK